MKPASTTISRIRIWHLHTCSHNRASRIGFFEEWSEYRNSTVYIFWPRSTVVNSHESPRPYQENESCRRHVLQFARLSSFSHWLGFSIIPWSSLLSGTAPAIYFHHVVPVHHSSQVSCGLPLSPLILWFDCSAWQALPASVADSRSTAVIEYSQTPL